MVISNDAANAALNRVVVIPLTSQTGKVYPGEALVTVNGQRSKAMADQITAAARQRLKNRAAVMSHDDVTAVENAVLLHLAIRR